MGNSRIPRLKIELISCHTKSDSPLDFRNDVIGFEKKKSLDVVKIECVIENLLSIWKQLNIK